MLKHTFTYMHTHTQHVGCVSLGTHCDCYGCGSIKLSVKLILACVKEKHPLKTSGLVTMSVKDDPTFP